MSWALLFAVAALTYASRALGLLVVPALQGRARDVLERLPVPLFASLAALPLVVDGSLVAWPVLTAFGGAVVAVLLRRTLLVALVGGLAGFAAGALLL